MYKFMVLSALIAIVAAKPGYHYEKPGYHYEKPEYHHEEEGYHYAKPLVYTTHTFPLEEHHFVEHIEREPTTISHHSTNIIHSTAKVSTPIITSHVKKYTAPIYETYVAPVVHTEHVHVPEVYTILKPTYETFPVKPVLDTHEFGYNYPVPDAHVLKEELIPEEHVAKPEAEYLPPTTVPEMSEEIEVTNPEFSGNEYIPPTADEPITPEDSGYHYTPPANKLD